MSTWQRISGLIDSADSRVRRASGFLEGARVIARLEYDPQEPASAWVCVAVDAGNHVAVLADDGQSVAPGPALPELALALAQECQASVTFDRETTTAEPAGDHADEDPFDPQIGIVVVAERAVLRSSGDLEDLEELATRTQSTLLGALDDHGYVVLIEDGPALADLPLDEAGQPLVVLQHAVDYPALGVAGGTQEYQHVWGLDAEAVPAGSALAREFADATLGYGLLAELVHAAVPSAAISQIRTAIEESEDAPGAVTALGLSAPLAQQVREFLLGQRQGSEVDGAVEIEPLSVTEHVRRRAQEAAEDARRLAEDARRRTDDVWRRGEDVWRRADEARVSTAAWAAEAEGPAKKWAPYVLAGVLVVGAALVWRRRVQR